jgi:hypothetical protein
MIAAIATKPRTTHLILVMSTTPSGLVSTSIPRALPNRFERAWGWSAALGEGSCAVVAPYEPRHPSGRHHDAHDRGRFTRGA